MADLGDHPSRDDTPPPAGRIVPNPGWRVAGEAGREPETYIPLPGGERSARLIAEIAARAAESIAPGVAGPSLDAAVAADEARDGLDAEHDLLRWLHAELDHGVRAALHGLDSELPDDAPLGARVDELHESYLDAPRVEGEYIGQIRQLTTKLDGPCGSCHPCVNYADETWHKAGRKPPHVVTWDDKVAEVANLRKRLGEAVGLIDDISNCLRQDHALTLGVESRRMAIAEEPARD